MASGDLEPPSPVTLRFEAVGADDPYAAVLDAIGQAVVVSDLDGHIVLWSRGAERLYGWSASGTLGLPLSDFLSASAADPVGHRTAGATPLDTWVGEAVIRHRDGTRTPVMVTNTPMLDHAGDAVGLVALTVDISVRKRAEETAQHLSAIVDSTADAIFTKDLDGLIRSWNRGAEHIFGYTAGDVVGQHVSMLDPEVNGAESASILRAVAAGQTLRGHETVRRRRDGSLVDVSLTVSPVYDQNDDVVAASVIGRDITDRRRLERELARLANHDTLTDLPNRVLLIDRLTQALARSKRRNRNIAILFVDLDSFRLVNANTGYIVGDQVLVEAASRLRAAVAPSDTVARFAGDAFVVVCEETSLEGAEVAAAAITSALAQPSEVADYLQRASATIGIVDAGGASATTADEIVRCAQAAMFTAKVEARGGWRIFDPDMKARWSRRIAVAADLRQALAADELEMHFQPIVELSTGRLVGLEALARWQHPTRGWVPPDLFVALAEEIGLIVELDDWAFDRACRDIAGMRAAGTMPRDVHLAVNVSARDVGPGLVARLVNHAENSGFPLDMLELEVTETALMADSRAAGRVLQTLREAGVGVALDDFGTGYSSLTYLRNLPLTSIKLDRAFVQHIATQPNDLAIAEAVADLARAVGVRTTAEGIETEAQLSLLHAAGYRSGQGWLWSPALPPPNLADLIQQHQGGFLTPQPGAKPLPRRRPAARLVDESGLRRLLQLHGDGASLTTIAAALNGEGYLTLDGYRWHSASVATVIADNAKPTL